MDILVKLDPRAHISFVSWLGNEGLWEHPRAGTYTMQAKLWHSIVFTRCLDKFSVDASRDLHLPTRWPLKCGLWEWDWCFGVKRTLLATCSLVYSAPNLSILQINSLFEHFAEKFSLWVFPSLSRLLFSLLGHTNGISWFSQSVVQFFEKAK